MKMYWYPLMRSVAIAAAVAIPVSATVAYAQEAPPRAQAVEDRLTPGDRTEFGYGEERGLSEYQGDPPPAGPVYQRDTQGRPFFRDAIGRIFRFSNRGRWIEVQPQGTVRGTAEAEAQQMARRPKLGARIEDADRGVRIVEVVRGSPADQAGLQPGDILLRVGGDEPADATQLARRIRGMEAGKEVDMTVLRDGDENQLTATLSRVGQQDRQRVARPAIEGGERSTVAQLRQEVEELKQEVQRLKQLHGEGKATAEQKQAEQQEQAAQQKEKAQSQQQAQQQQQETQGQTKKQSSGDDGSKAESGQQDAPSGDQSSGSGGTESAGSDSEQGQSDQDGSDSGNGSK